MPARYSIPVVCLITSDLPTPSILGRRQYLLKHVVRMDAHPSIQQTPS
jgi:hypothetical protein